MSVAQILQVILIVTNVLADNTVGTPDTDELGGIVAILGMLEDELLAQVKGDVGNG